MRGSINKLVALVVIAAVAVGVLTLPFHSTAQAQAMGKIRFVHAVPGGPSVDVYIDDALAAADLKFAAGTRFVNATLGTRNIKVTAAGDKNTVLASQTVTLTVDYARTIVVEGAVGAVEIADYESDLNPVAPGKVRFAAIHAVKGAPAVDVFRVDGQTLLQLGQGVTYSKPFGGVDIPAGTPDVLVVATGGDVSKPLIRAKDEALTAGSNVTVVVLGTLDKLSTLTLVAATQPEDATKAALVRFVHASNDSPAVDVYVNKLLIAPNLTFGTFTPHLALTAGKATIEVRLAKAIADSPALLTADADLTAGKAATVVVSGPSDGLAATVTEDNIAGATANKARINVINAAGKNPVNIVLAGKPLTLTPGGTDVDQGIYDLSMSTTAPDVKFSGTFTANGGVLYDFVLAGDAKTNQVIVAATGLAEQPGSVPTGAPVVAAQPTATETPLPAVPTETPTAAQPTAAPVVETPVPAVTATPVPVVAAPTETPVPVVPAVTATPAVVEVAPTNVPTAVAEAPTETPAAVEVAPTAVPAKTGTTGVTAVVSTDPGVNLKLREYPKADSKTLALIPSGTTVDVEGIAGPAILAGTPTPAKTATLSATGVSVDNLWVFITWTQSDGGKVTGWTKPQYLTITNAKNERISSVKALVALPQVPENEFGTISSGAVTPVAPDTNRMVGIVNTTNAGVNLQLRRTPGIDGESLALLPTGAELTVYSKTEVKSKGGVVGEPASTMWFYVRFDTTTGSVTGWVNSQFVSVTQKNRPVKIEDIPTATEITPGKVEGSLAPATQPPAPGLVATADKLNSGVNLQFRRQPNANAESLALIPNGTQMKVLGRNGSGQWIQVEFGGQTGWVSSNFVTVRKDGKLFKVQDIKNVTDEPDTAGTPTVTPTATVKP